MRKNHDKAGDTLGMLCFLATIATIAIPAYQVFMWLKEGTWIAVPIWTVLNHFGIIDLHFTSWVGLQRIFDWILELPFFLVPGFVAVVLGGMSSDRS